MDSKNNELKKWIKNMDEVFFVSISNKGLYKKALKDIEKGLIESYQELEEGFEIKTTESTVLIKTDIIDNIECTCPARGLCKHKLASLIYMNEKLNQEISEETEEEEIYNFSYLLDFDIEKLKKMIKDSNLNEIIERIDFGIGAEFEEGKYLKIKFERENYNIMFPSNSKIEDSICSCKANDFCIHKAEALIRYLLKENKINLDDLRIEKKEKEIEKYFNEFREILENIFISGISKLPYDILEKLEQISVYCAGANLYYFEKKTLAIKNEISKYFSKEAVFSDKKFLDLITKTYLILELAEDNKEIQKMIYQNRASYFRIGDLNLNGLGLEKWEGFKYSGYTAYFIDEFNKTYSYSQIISSQFSESKIWNSNFSIFELAENSFLLSSAKTNNSGRLSSNSETNISKIQKSNFEIIRKNAFNNWKVLMKEKKESLEYSFFDKEEIEPLFIKVNKFDNFEENKILNFFKFDLLDEEDNKFEVFFSDLEKNKKIISKFNDFIRNKRFPDTLMIKLFIKNNKILTFPISGYYEDILINFSV